MEEGEDDVVNRESPRIRTPVSDDYQLTPRQQSKEIPLVTEKGEIDEFLEKEAGSEGPDDSNIQILTPCKKVSERVDNIRFKKLSL